MSPDDFFQNKARLPGVVISASKACPTGNGARDPGVLLNDRIQYLDGQPHAAFDQCLTFDTYDGQNETEGPDWYQLSFPEPVTINCIEMTMGFAYIDGGWWKSLAVEVRTESNPAWQPVENIRIVPPYDFRDTGAGRKPFQTHVLLFDDTHIQAFRLVGQPGGLAQLTSLARIAAYHRDLSVWNPASLPDPPIPQLFKLIDPNMLWDMSESFVKLTGLGLDIFHLASYLDEARYQAYWRTVSPQYVERTRHLWREDISVADVAYFVNVSPAYFCCLFTEETGRNPRDYLIDLRIARAKEFLKHTDMSIAGVCAMLNYHPVYFSRLFKQKTGISPSDFARKAHRK